MASGEEPLGLQVAGKKVSAAVPLKSCSVRAALNGYVVGLDSTLKYVNKDTSPLEVSCATLLLYPYL